MGFRYVPTFEVRELLRLWLRGGSLRGVEEQAGVDTTSQDAGDARPAVSRANSSWMSRNLPQPEFASSDTHRELLPVATSHERLYQPVDEMAAVSSRELQQAPPRSGPSMSYGVTRVWLSLRAPAICGAREVAAGQREPRREG